MFFQNVTNIKTIQEKKTFLESVDIANHIIEKGILFYGLDNPNLKDEKDAEKQLVHFGIIKSSYEKQILKNILKKEYDRFLNNLSIYAKNKNKFSPIMDNFSNQYRKSIQEEKTNNKAPTVIDLFCGAGGFSLGFSAMGYKILLANDIDNDALRTYSFNHPEVNSNHIICDDIKKISQKIPDYINEDVDVIIGGPPCQSFSSANQQRIIDDPRNILYKYFVKIVKDIKPKFIVMENVRGMMVVADQVVQDFEKINYSVKYKLYDATDFSVPQKRIRLIYIGINKHYAKENKLTVDQVMDDISREIHGNSQYVLKDALEGIIKVSCPKEKNQTQSDDESGSRVSINVIKSNEYLDLINHNKKHPFIFNHKARYQNETNLKIYSLLKQGEDSTSETIKNIMPYAHRNHIFKDKYFRLINKEPCRTITAHLKMDCHSHIHPTQTRAITPREAARIQSFPDDYLFFGPYLKTYMQIGNAVPPLMSKTFAKTIKKYLIKN